MTDRSQHFILDLLRERTRHSNSDLSKFCNYARRLESTTMLEWASSTARERSSLITAQDPVEHSEMVKFIDNICTPFIKTLPLELVPLVNVDGFISAVTRAVVQKYIKQKMQATVILVGRTKRLSIGTEERLVAQGFEEVTVKLNNVDMGRTLKSPEDYFLFNARVKKMEDDIAEMKEAMASLKTDHEALRGRHEALQGRHEALQGRHEALRGRHEALQGRHEALRGRHEALQGRHEALQVGHDTLEIYCDIIRAQNEETQFKVERMDHVISNVKTMFIGDRIKNVCPVCHENIHGSRVRCKNGHPGGEVCDFCMCRLEAVRDESDIPIVKCPVCREVMVKSGDLRSEESV